WERDADITAELVELGWQEVRVTAPMLRGARAVLRQVGAALERGRVRCAGRAAQAWSCCRRRFGPPSAAGAPRIAIAAARATGGGAASGGGVTGRAAGPWKGRARRGGAAQRGRGGRRGPQRPRPAGGAGGLGGVGGVGGVAGRGGGRGAMARAGRGAIASGEA